MAAIFKKYDVRLVQEHSGLYELDKKNNIIHTGG